MSKNRTITATSSQSSGSFSNAFPVLISIINLFLFCFVFVNAASAVDMDSDNIDDSVNIDSNGNGLIEIYTLEQLDHIRNKPDGSAYNDGSGDITTGCGNGAELTRCIGYELMNDLDFDTNGDGSVDSEDLYWNGGEGWEPIAGFTAIFEGNNHEIRNLHISRSEEGPPPGSGVLGLFGSINDAVIRNVHLKDASITSSSSLAVGMLAGWVVNNSEIKSSSATGVLSLSGKSFRVGGLVGSVENSTITASHTSGMISTLASIVAGGVVGSLDNSVIEDSHSNVNVSISGGDGNEIGGLAGHALFGSEITGSHATGSISMSADNPDFSSGNNIGGLVGAMSEATTIINSHYRGDITVGAGDVGGLVGSTHDVSLIEDSFATVTIVTRGDYDAITGGLAGSLGASIIRTSSADVNMRLHEFDNGGGLVGNVFGDSLIEDSYAQGRISGQGAGGLIAAYNVYGFDDGGDLRIINSYSSVAIYPSLVPGFSGGLIGIFDQGNPEIINTYWDIDTTRQTTSPGGGEGKSRRQLQCPTSNDTDCHNGDRPFAEWDPKVWDFGTEFQYPALIIDGVVRRGSGNEGNQDAEDLINLIITIIRASQQENNDN